MLKGVKISTHSMLCTSEHERITNKLFLFRCPGPRRRTPTWRATGSTSRSYHRCLKLLNSPWEHLFIWLWVGQEALWCLLGGGSLMGFGGVSWFCVQMSNSEHRLCTNNTSPINSFFIDLKKKLKIPRVKGNLAGIQHNLLPIAAGLFTTSQMVARPLLE